MADEMPQDQKITSIDHPHHYNLGVVEHCAMVEDQGQADGYYFGQITKYLFRRGTKPGTTLLGDLRKAKWYLDRWILWKQQGPAIWEFQQKLEDDGK